MNESFKYEEKNIIKDKDLPPDSQKVVLQDLTPGMTRRSA